MVSVERVAVYLEHIDAARVKFHASKKHEKRKRVNELGNDGRPHLTGELACQTIPTANDNNNPVMHFTTNGTEEKLPCIQDRADVSFERSPTEEKSRMSSDYHPCEQAASAIVSIDEPPQPILSALRDGTRSEHLDDNNDDDECLQRHDHQIPSSVEFVVSTVTVATNDKDNDYNDTHGVVSRMHIFCSDILCGQVFEVRPDLRPTGSL
jgi:hypothetical protein